MVYNDNSFTKFEKIVFTWIQIKCAYYTQTVIAGKYKNTRKYGFIIDGNVYTNQKLKKN